MLATQNPIEYEGTYPLPEAQLDRFLLRIGIGYPDREDEWRCSRAAPSASTTTSSSSAIVDAPTLRAMQRAVEEVYVSESVGIYMVDLVAATRDNARTEVGASPRGSLALFKLARCRPRSCGPRLRHPRRREGDRGARARPPAHAQAGAVGAARAAGGDRGRDRLDTVPTPAPEAFAGARMTRGASARLAAYAGSPHRALPRASCSAGPSSPRSALRSRPSSSSRSRSAPADRELTLARPTEERTIEGEPVDCELELSAVGALHELELALRLPHGSSSPTGANHRAPARAGRAADAGRARRLALGRLPAGSSLVRVRDRFGLLA